ncbi:hypothetical protein [Lacticaseibacillus saniviri]|uniref:hypothetical protein n=1 Tax=Lacticaseibacillus saniviri TaxID=931533 RepID=UPI000AC4414B|nr:hypothetical protein [Lacticaseibacillus saniviri]
MIINMKPKVMSILNSIEELKLSSTTYPDEWSKFPMAVYSTVHEPYFVNAEQHEGQTKWQITVELYSDTGSLTLITEKLRTAFAGLGFLVPPLTLIPQDSSESFAALAQW